MSKPKALAAAVYGWPPNLPTSTATLYTGRSRWTLYRAIATGELAVAGRRGRSLTFRRDDLDRWMLGDGEPPRTAAPPARAPRAVAPPADVLERLAAIRRGGR